MGTEIRQKTLKIANAVALAQILPLLWSVESLWRAHREEFKAEVGLKIIFSRPSSLTHQLIISPTRILP
jgi:hypothetical protein